VTEARYLRGIKAAATYCGISDRATFRNWCARFEITPRIINGQAYFDRRALDQFMSPERNAPGASELFWRGTATSSGK
jgi:hypothetical protein